MRELTAERLREFVSYDPDDGSFTWIAGRWGGYLDPGRPNSKGYLRIGIDGREYMAHRLAYLYMTGEWPPAQIDHVNGRRYDNRWANLRPATQSENLANGGARADSITGLRGVSRHKGKYRARIVCNGRQISLGLHATPGEAAEAYRKAALGLFGQFAALGWQHGGRRPRKAPKLAA